MAKKLFGGKSGSRFSGSRESVSREPEQLPEDLFSFLGEEPEQASEIQVPEEIIFPERPVASVPGVSEDISQEELTEIPDIP